MDQALLFVYGTLRRGFNNQWQQILESKASWLGTATTSGYLFDLGPYPGAKYAPEGDLITGDLYAIQGKSSQNLIAELDEYEGEEYTRIWIQTECNGKKKNNVFFYEYLGKTNPDMRIFPADYQVYLQRSYRSK